MVDIHCHILWGLDDGPRSLEESVEMAHLAAETGTTDIVATPHANNQFTFDAARVAERAAELRNACGNTPRLHLGADFHLSFQNIESALREPRRFTVNQLKYLMVELPETLIPPTMRQIFERMSEVGITPVITHPERNRAIWNDERMFDDWLDAGCLVQVTAQSLEGHFGRSAKEIAWRLLDENRVHFLASDGHDTTFRPPRLDRVFAKVAKKLGEETAARLFRDNPKCVIEGAPLPPSLAARKQKPRFRLFG